MGGIQDYFQGTPALFPAGILDRKLNKFLALT
jgi:hypothetical protein